MDRRATAVTALQARLGYAFRDLGLLETALTHSSAGSGGPRRPENYERLEFLGDRVLGLAIAQALFEAQAGADAGELSKRFATLVSREACARVAREIGVGEALRLPGGESRRGAREHETLLADACEALIAALHIELGFEGAARIVRALWSAMMDEPLDLQIANPKSTLQEWAASVGRAPPVYRVVSRSGPDHSPTFVVAVEVEGEPEARGRGGSLQAAQKAAALALLERRSAPS